MFVHIGNSNVVRTKSIVAIIDYNLYASSDVVENIVNIDEKSQKIVEIDQTPKSIVITSDLIYYSSLSVYTLQKRSGYDSMMKKTDKFRVEG